jgi:hypothetical protein
MLTLGKARAIAIAPAAAPMNGMNEDTMVRRITLALLMFTLTLPACGRQVTGLQTGTSQPASNGLAGEMEIKFRTFGPMDFSNVNYVIVFNTSGVGGEPYANVFATTGCNYSFAFAVGPSYGNATASLFQIFIPPGSTRLAFNQVTLSPGTTNLSLNANGQNTEFDLTFARSQFNVPAPVSGSVNPCGNTASAPTAVPSPSPSGASSPAPGASAGATPVPSPTAPAQAVWYINFFTTSTGGAPLDALGFGVNDTSFSLPVDVSTNVDQQIFRQAGVTPPSSQSAFIAGGEIINVP